jgi:hypothetical protein
LLLEIDASISIAVMSGRFTMNVAMFLLAGIVIALCLYILRARARLLYGLLELASGVVIMLGAINSYSAALGRENVPIVGGGIFHRAPEGWLHWSAPSVALFGVAAAIYILVRGLDNVGEGLRESNPGWYGKWQRCFRGR